MLSKTKSISVLAFLSAVLVAIGANSLAHFVRTQPQAPVVSSVPERPRPVFTRPIEFEREPVLVIDKGIEKLQSHVRTLIRANDFSALDRLGSKLSHKRERFIGGEWKIAVFTGAVSEPEGEYPDDIAWETRVKFLYRWREASPRSIFARTALAQGLIGYGYHVRGKGYAKDVLPRAMEIFRDRVAAAAAELAEADVHIEEKYHGYYFSVIQMAMLQSWDRPAMEEAFQQAISYDRQYENFYSAKAQYLQPKWGGQPGELGAFLNELQPMLGEREGRKVYFYVVAELQSINSGQFFHANKISWNDVKRGAEYYEKDYGIGRRLLNETAQLTSYVNDAESGCYIYGLLKHKDAYDVSVWRNKDNFEGMKKWALRNLCDRIPEQRDLRQRSQTWKELEVEAPSK